ncbi:MAG: helix-turn-helix transcriptional regulator [Candidatus Omnitrophica bacterium]|nr:helix-turn-helix transcriptional regulator [Candidatus Omnitrophota bacterium]MBU4590137.1 helix-turn-helix transcriptional regulator [Candidatus Omnitrophota bacterium]
MNLQKIRSILPNRVRTFRNARGLTQEHLAEAVDIHATYISRIESGKKLPTLTIICKIADALGVEAYELLVDERKVNSSDYKKKRLIGILNESKPDDIDTYSKLLKVLRGKRK